MHTVDFVPGLSVEGRGKVELFDDRWKKLEEVPFKNTIAPQGIEYFKYMMRRAVLSPVPGSTQVDSSDELVSAAVSDAVTVPLSDPDPLFPFTALYLTDSTKEVSATDSHLPGKIIGYATRKLYTGADLFRGTINLAESVFTKELSRFVFDWPTHAALGSINSVGWCNADLVSATISPSHFPGVSFEAPSTGTAAETRANGGYDPVSGTVWSTTVSNSGTNALIFKMIVADPTDAVNFDWDSAPAISIPTTNVTRAASMVRIGNELFVTGYAGRIISVWDWPTLTTQTLPTAKRILSPPSDGVTGASSWMGKGLATDGTNLWNAVGLTSTTFRLYKLSPADGSVLASYTYTLPTGVTSSEVYGVAYNADDDVVAVRVYALGKHMIRLISAVDGTEIGAFIATGSSSSSNIFYVGSGNYAMTHSNGVVIFNLSKNLGARTKLAAPVNKLNTINFRATYEFAYA